MQWWGGAIGRVGCDIVAVTAVLKVHERSPRGSCREHRTETTMCWKRKKRKGQGGYLSNLPAKERVALFFLCAASSIMAVLKRAHVYESHTRYQWLAAFSPCVQCGPVLIGGVCVFDSLVPRRLSLLSSSPTMALA